MTGIHIFYIYTVAAQDMAVLIDLGVWIKGQDRTLENLILDNELWETNSGDRQALKHFNNVEFKPLLKTPTIKLLENDLKGHFSEKQY